MQRRKISYQTNYRIRVLHKEGLDNDQIRERISRIKPTDHEIDKAVHYVKWIWWRIGKYTGVKEVKCNICWFYKVFSLEYFPSYWKRNTLQTRCRQCRFLQKKNLEVFRNNMWIKVERNWNKLNPQRRRIRTIVNLIIDLDKLKKSNRHNKLKKRLNII